MEYDLRRLQLTELEILKTVDAFCARHAIRYSLYGGTLLGAVRHQGFIPWDDDLDICMKRSEYDRFLKLWEKEPPAGYILQNKENTPDFDQMFTKIRKDHTTFLQQRNVGKELHTGIFIDVFPLDRLPNGKRKRLLYTFRCMRYLLYTREFVPPKDKGTPLQRAVAFVLLKAVPPERRQAHRQRLLSLLTQYNSDGSLCLAATYTASAVKIPHPPDMMDSFVDLQFEDRRFPCCACWEDTLKSIYGDYRQLPPENGRSVPHAPLVVDFERNLDEINR